MLDESAGRSFVYCHSSLLWSAGFCLLDLLEVLLYTRQLTKHWMLTRIDVVELENSCGRRLVGGLGIAWFLVSVIKTYRRVMTL